MVDVDITAQGNVEIGDISPLVRWSDIANKPATFPPAYPSDGNNNDVLTKTDNGAAWLPASGISGASNWNQLQNKPFNTIGDGLKVEGNALKVDTATAAAQDNTKPITSGAVYMEIGNINALLGTI